MMPEQDTLFVQAQSSLKAARLLQSAGLYGFAASRAYYAMFYIAEAFLLGKGLSFSKHSAVHAAFGEHFVKAGQVSKEFHNYLIHGMEVRHAGDYGGPETVSMEECADQIAHAEKFLELATLIIAPT